MSKLVSEEYLEVLNKVHSNGEWGRQAGVLLGGLAPFIREWNTDTVLDYGAGAGSFKRNLHRVELDHINVIEYEPGIPEKSNPPQPQNYVICIDVLEHIEPELIDNVLADLDRVTLKEGIFSIDLGPANRILPDGRNAHLLIKPKEWWQEKLEKYWTVKEFGTVEGSYRVIVTKK